MRKREAKAFLKIKISKKPNPFCSVSFAFNPRSEDLTFLDWWRQSWSSCSQFAELRRAFRYLGVVGRSHSFVDLTLDSGEEKKQTHVTVTDEERF